ncbi:hypothetical protein C2U36_27195, partial [Escherichia coli]
TTGFDFQQAGKEVLAIERECLAELDQYINQNFKRIMSHVELQPGLTFSKQVKKSWRLNVNAWRSLINTSIRIS